MGRAGQTLGGARLAFRLGAVTERPWCVRRPRVVNPHVQLNPPCARARQSEVEETLERVKVQSGVEG